MTLVEMCSWFPTPTRLLAECLGDLPATGYGDRDEALVRVAGYTSTRNRAAGYSARSACIGSNREARHAGSIQARVATMSSVQVTATYTAGSSGLVS
jgi:hypothetical protein